MEQYKCLQLLGDYPGENVGVSMNGKQAKKLRQLYKRNLHQEVVKQADKQAEAFQERMKKFEEDLGQLLKPAPKWMPEFIWISLQRIFLNV